MLTRTQSTPARLTAIATVKPPRLALFALCLAYIVFGLFERDPWKTDDDVWLATMLSALDLGGSAWLMPQVGPITMWVNSTTRMPARGRGRWGPRGLVML